MANKLYVTEYASVVGAAGSQQSGDVLPSPPLASQVVTIAAAPGNTSIALNANTKMIAVTTDTACCIRVGVRTALVAAATDFFLPANAAPVKFAVTPDMGVAACTP